jgi:4-amino-4-deoxy-L-arabinose transferase-like glycosyltransferase
VIAPTASAPPLTVEERRQPLPGAAAGGAEAAGWRWALIWIVVAALLRAVLSSLVPLLPDETYYWLWTHRIEAGYFDHPPGIAFLIRLGTLLFGETTIGVRTGPAIAALLTHVTAVMAAWYLAGKGEAGARSASRAALLLLVIPIATLGLVLATPDAALFAMATAAILGVERALAAPLRSWSGFGWWTLAGVCLGAAFVAKYTAVLLPLGLVVACLMHPALRARFREGGPWWASVIALTLFAPVVLWNYVHEWISFRFQLGHGFNPSVRGSVLSRELELLGGQAGLASPILFVLLAMTVWYAARDGWRSRHSAQSTDASVRRFALAVISVVPMLFFAVSASRRSVEANWPALIYPSAVLLLATETRTFAMSRWWTRGVAFAAFLLLVVSLQAWRPLLPLAPRKDPIARAHGWVALAAAVERARKDPFLDGTVDRWVATNRYQESAEVAFHLPDQPMVFSLNINSRPNQFDLWETAYDEVRLGDGMVAVFDDNPDGDALGVRVGAWFAESKRGEAVELRRGDGVVTTRRIWLYRIARNVPARPRELPSLSGAR